MGEMMLFPDSVEEFMEYYKVVDTEHIYSNGVEFVPIFRMRQWFDRPKEPRCPHCGGLIERRGDEWYCYGCHFWWEDKDAGAV